MLTAQPILTALTALDRLGMRKERKKLQTQIL